MRLFLIYLSATSLFVFSSCGQGVEEGENGKDASIDSATGDTDTDNDTDTDSDTDTDNDTDTDSDTDTDTDTDTDADADADADADSDFDGGGDADADADFCDPDTEVYQPGTDLCWRRCPLNQTLDAGSCEGTIISVQWCMAAGEDHDWCDPDNPGVSRCEEMLGSEYRLPTGEEFAVLLEAPNGVDSLGKECDGNDGDTMCTDMFGRDSGRYWSSSLGPGSQGAWFAEFNRGRVSSNLVYTYHNVRCVRSRP